VGPLNTANQFSTNLVRIPGAVQILFLIPYRKHRYPDRAIGTSFVWGFPPPPKKRILIVGVFVVGKNIIYASNSYTYYY